jgi:DNA polymerase-3 subunit delta'
MTELPEFILPQGQALLSLIAEQKLPQTLLLHGPKGIGKALFARQLACYLLGGGTGEGGLFGPATLEVDPQSPTVARVLAGSHGDYLLLEPEFSGQNQTPIIKIDAARKVAEFFSKTAAESNWRVVIVDGAEALNPNAANALLKTVEEPPLNALMILVSHQSGKLLPTLLSRCRKIAFNAPSEEDFQAILQYDIEENSSDTLNMLYVLSHGSPGKAIQLHSQQGEQMYAKLVSLFEAYPSKAHSQIASMAAHIEKHAKQGGWVTWCELWLAFLQRLNLAAIGALGPEALNGEKHCLERLAAAQPEGFWQEVRTCSIGLIGKANGLHLDRKQVINSLIAMAFNEVELAA